MINKQEVSKWWSSVRVSWENPRDEDLAWLVFYELPGHGLWEGKLHLKGQNHTQWETGQVLPLCPGGTCGQLGGSALRVPRRKVNTSCWTSISNPLENGAHNSGTLAWRPCLTAVISGLSIGNNLQRWTKVLFMFQQIRATLNLPGSERSQG